MSSEQSLTPVDPVEPEDPVAALLALHEGALANAESNVRALRAELHVLERLMREKTEQLYHEIGAADAFKITLGQIRAAEG